MRPKCHILTDEGLFSLLRVGDREAFSEIYARFSGPIYVHVYNKLRNREEAKDAVQDLFTNLWVKREKIELRGDLMSYLYGMARNRVFRMIERKGLQSDYVSDIQHGLRPENNITDHHARESILSAMIRREIDALPPKMREIFIMSRKQYMSHREIAESLGLTEPTVKKQVNNALKILRVKLGLLVYLLMLIR